MRKKIILAGTMVISSLSFAQIKTNGNVSANTIPSQTPFLDASSSISWNNSVNIGKGLVFPRTDLTKLSNLVATPNGIGVSYPHRLDGMVVYNIATGKSAIGNIDVVPGFYYYENKSTTLNGGTWKSLGSATTLAGADGKSVLNGTAEPLSTTGTVGDFYINTATNQIFGPKTASGWGAGTSLVGLQGPRGLTGATGPAGAIGPKGDKGDTGATGPAGPQGPRGLTGATGPAGAVGPKGDKGDTGATGPAGPQGPRGLTGATGPAGAVGPKGDKGDTGATGPAGPQGPRGLTGATGPAGAVGPKGDKGDTGATGPAGPQGPRGLTGATGPKGDTGVVGGVNGITYNSNTKTVGLPAGTSTNQVLKWNGKAWTAQTDANTTYASSTTNTIVGNQIQRAALTGDVTAGANSNTTTIAPNAVTSAKIADGTITGADIANGTITANKLAPGVIPANTNIYTNDGTLSANRTVTMNGKTLNFTGGLSTFEANSYYPLTINSTNRLGGGLRIMPNGDNTKRVELSVKENGNFRIWAEADRLSVDRTTGNVGIGTGTPAAKLDVNGTLRISNSSWTSNQTSTLEFSNGSYKSGATSQIIDQMNGAGDGGANLLFSTQSPTPGTNPNLTEPTEKMRITADGNVGIGTASPSEKLHAVGGIRSTGSTNIGGYIDLENTLKTGETEGARWRIYNMTDKQTGSVYTPGLHFWNYSQSKTQPNLGSKMILSDEGNLGIGLPSREAPSAKLDVNGTTRLRNLPNGDPATDKVLLADASGNIKQVASTNFKGPKGDTGATGATGARGPQGLQGPKGDTGVVGGVNGITYNSNTKTVGLPTGTSTNQVLKWNGKAWTAQTDANTTYASSTTNTIVGNQIQRAALTGDVTARANSNTTTIAPNAVTSAKIADGTITGADIANGTITANKLAPGVIPANTNIYTNNGTLSANRTVTMNGKSLTFSGSNTQIKVPNMQERPANEKVSGVVMASDGTLKKDTDWWRLGDGEPDIDRINYKSIVYLDTGIMRDKFNDTSWRYDGIVYDTDMKARFARVHFSSLADKKNYLKKVYESMLDFASDAEGVVLQYSSTCMESNPGSVPSGGYGVTMTKGSNGVRFGCYIPVTTIIAIKY
ncbi:hypothetical protein [Riemerella anatipestifer]|uniref:hypothetical protein n=1 Tax=Riemerella anatipestifer TaxID=34085 RepID=UPI00259BEB1C|nr:hypothetical protein [Riemerella anatipestifer]